MLTKRKAEKNQTSSSRTIKKAKLSDNNSAIVKFNVGGQIYESGRETLIQPVLGDKHHILYLMFREDSPFTLQLDSKKRPFLDRDAKLFDQILGFMRGGCSTELLSEMIMSPNRQRLATEALFFGMLELSNILDKNNFSPYEQLGWFIPYSGSKSQGHRNSIRCCSKKFNLAISNFSFAMYDEDTEFFDNYIEYSMMSGKFADEKENINHDQIVCLALTCDHRIQPSKNFNPGWTMNGQFKDDVVGTALSFSLNFALNIVGPVFHVRNNQSNTTCLNTGSLGTMSGGKWIDPDKIMGIGLRYIRAEKKFMWYVNGKPTTHEFVLHAPRRDLRVVLLLHGVYSATSVWHPPKPWTDEK